MRIFLSMMLLCACLPHTGLAQDAPDATGTEAVVVTAKRLSEVLVPVTRDVEGILVTRNDSPISAELSGRVLDIRVDVGDRVKRGAVLARLDCRDYQASLRQAAAAVGTVRARIVSAQAQVGTFKARRAAAQARMQASKARAQTFRSRINASGARVKTAMARVGSSRAQIESINSRVAATGARVPAAQAQLRLAQNDFRRVQQLRNQQLVPQNQLDQARSALDSARSNFDGVRADRVATQSEMSAANANVAAAQAEVEAVRADTEAAKADFSAAQADVVAAQADVSAAQADIVRAQGEQATVQSELESALAQEAAARVVTERCLITAPFEGQVSERFLQKGQVASPGNPAFQLIQTRGLEVSARLSQADLNSQQQGKNLQLVVGALELPLKQRAVIDQLSGNSRTQEVRYVLEEEANFPIGQTGRVQWQAALPAVPAEWILRREGGLGLMLIKDGKAVFERLDTAREGQPVLVDLPEDTLLIDRNRLRVRNGQAVRFPDEDSPSVSDESDPSDESN